MDIVDYPDYIIYDDGRVFSKYKNRYRKPTKDNRDDGYLQIGLFNLGKRKMFKIHRLVALHYIPNPANKSDVDHIDGDKTNNHVDNLRWATRSDNCNSFKKHYKNNKSGVKNISYSKQNNNWQYDKKIYGKRHQKYFRTLDEAIEYKKEYELIKHSR